MIEDEVLKWRFKQGSTKALGRIYEKYLNYLLTVAMGLLNDVAAAEDVVHDVFVSFARAAVGFSVRGSLKGYLATCVANRSRDVLRKNRVRAAGSTDAAEAERDREDPAETIIGGEETQLLAEAIAALPSEQREVVVLRLKGEMKFDDIAKCQGVSVNTARGRYRYGVDRLRSVLGSEV